MTITAGALALIRNELRASRVAHPVVYLARWSKTPHELSEAVARGASPDELRRIAANTLPDETKYLHPLIYPRSNFLWLFTRRTGDIRFAASFFYPRKVRRALNKGVLDVASRGLILKDIDGSVVLP